MQTTVDRRQAARDRSERAFGAAYAQLRFADSQATTESLALRDALVAEIARQMPPTHRGTKLATALSPGCAACASGAWSCLFINERCNARCFYCPASQQQVGVPMTNSVPFPNAREYVEYVARFGFEGVSISGGEPLLTLDRTLQYLRTVKRRFGASIHSWLYTNGTLLDDKAARQLKEAGLDEIRIDIGATGYHLDKVALAAHHFDCVTVEVPAVPEDFELLSLKLEEMVGVGVRFLNLHQLRLTPHNLPQLVKRGYTFAQGDAVVVSDSELTALRLVQRVLDERIPLGINYCSAIYKSRYQRAAARRRSGAIVKRPYEEITESGYLRQLRVHGPQDALASLASRLSASGASPDSWSLQGEVMAFSATLWPLIEPASWRFSVSYAMPSIVPAVRYRNAFTEVPLGKKRKIAVERAPAAEPFELAATQTETFYRRYLAATSTGVAAIADGDALPDALHPLECVEEGLEAY